VVEREQARLVCDAAGARRPGRDRGLEDLVDVLAVVPGAERAGRRERAAVDDAPGTASLVEGRSEAHAPGFSHGQRRSLVLVRSAA
jgi:hypothetical protein